MFFTIQNSTVSDRFFHVNDPSRVLASGLGGCVGVVRGTWRKAGVGPPGVLPGAKQVSPPRRGPAGAHRADHW